MSILRDLGVLGCLTALSPMISLKSVAFPREGEVEIACLYLAFMAALIQHHAAEGQEVVDGRDEPSAPGGKRRRTAPLATLGLVVDHGLAGHEVGPIFDRKPLELLRRNAEVGVGHPERLEEAFAQERVEGKA